MSYSIDLYQARGTEWVREILLVNATSIPADPSDHWTIEVRAVGEGQEQGRRLIPDFSTSRISLAANERVAIYDKRAAIRLDDGERIRAVVTKTGSPPSLAHPALIVNLLQVN